MGGDVGSEQADQAEHLLGCGWGYGQRDPGFHICRGLASRSAWVLELFLPVCDGKERGGVVITLPITVWGGGIARYQHPQRYRCILSAIKKADNLDPGDASQIGDYRGNHHDVAVLQTDTDGDIGTSTP